MSVPSTPPSPPVYAVPPISTAAITVSSSVGSACAEAPVRRPTCTTEASPAASPAMPYVTRTTRPTSMPLRRAASGFEPTANSERPKPV